METVLMYKAENGKCFEKKSDALKADAAKFVFAMYQRHEKKKRAYSQSSIQVICEYFSDFVEQGGNPWKLLKDLLHLRKLFREIEKAKKTETPDDIPF